MTKIPNGHKREKLNRMHTVVIKPNNDKNSLHVNNDITNVSNIDISSPSVHPPPAAWHLGYLHKRKLKKYKFFCRSTHIHQRMTNCLFSSRLDISIKTPATQNHVTSYSKQVKRYFPIKGLH